MKARCACVVLRCSEVIMWIIYLMKPSVLPQLTPCSSIRWVMSAVIYILEFEVCWSDIMGVNGCPVVGMQPRAHYGLCVHLRLASLPPSPCMKLLANHPAAPRLTWESGSGQDPADVSGCWQRALHRSESRAKPAQSPPSARCLLFKHRRTAAAQLCNTLTKQLTSTFTFTCVCYLYLCVSSLGLNYPSRRLHIPIQ